MSNINTNMASEFWFFSQLHRLGYKAYITLGNTKGIDITVQLNNGVMLTFDVKGKESFKNGTYQYLPDDRIAQGHYFVFIGLEVVKQKNSSIILFNAEPICYIVEACNLHQVVFHWKSSNTAASGFGLNQRIFSILKQYDPSHRLISKEQKILDQFKKEGKYSDADVIKLKTVVHTIEDFENKYHLLK